MDCVIVTAASLQPWGCKAASSCAAQAPNKRIQKIFHPKSQSPADAWSHSYSMSNAQGWWRVSCGLCVWQDLGQGAGRDELTHAEHHQSSSKVISITGAHLLHESHPIHHCYCLDVTLPARAWPLSLQKAPDVLYSSFILQDLDQCSCLTHCPLPHFSGAVGGAQELRSSGAAPFHPWGFTVPG